MMMGSSSYLCLVSILMIASNLISFSYSFSSSSLKPRCHDDERTALLQFKDSFSSTNSCSWDYDYPKVEKWKFVRGENSSDCCSWDGVECDDKTNHVISLDLSDSCLFGSINSTSSLFTLLHLKSLNLAFNNFTFSKIPSEIGSLSSLTYLNLSDSEFSGQIPLQISNLSNLVSLDLSSNDYLELHKPNLKGLVRNLSNLKELDPSNINISSSVPDLLSNFSSLESLRLDYCGLKGEFPLSIFHLPNLKMIHLYGNEDLRGYLPRFNSGSSLQSLMLFRTNFGGELPPSIGNLTNLQVLDISSCSFTGMLPSSLGDLHNLTTLDLSDNSFSAPTSSLSWVGKLSKLSMFGLYHLNLNLTREFPSSLLNLTQLSDLDLGYNQLTGPLPSWLMNFTNLVGLYLDHNHLNGRIPSSLIYQTKIRNLYLGSNQLSGQIPSQTCNHSELIDLDLSFNELQGSIPTSLSYLKNLQLLNLFSNNLVGEVDLNLFLQLKNLTTLMLSYNNLSLVTKSNINATVNFDQLGLAFCNLSEFPSFLRRQENLQFLDVSSNNIDGQIPSWIWNITSLSYLNISNNFLTGFEEGPVFHQWVHLNALDLRSNRLEGSLSNPLHESVSSTLRNGCYLIMINLSENRLTGQLPRSLANCSSLEFVDVGSNQLADVYPSWLGILPQLKVLILQSNGFFGALGEIQKGEFSKLQIIDISHNLFSGELPTTYFEDWDAMKNADSSNNVTYMGKTENGLPVFAYTNYDFSITLNNKGLELEYLKIPSSLAAIDFSHNKFKGEIPNIIGNLTGIHLLNLSNNMITGQIPSSMANMKQLECLDLSGNKLFGEIPSQFTKLTSLSSFNVSYNNNLSGPIPHGNQFDTFDSTSYEGNLGLCGAPLKKKCENFDPPNPSNLTKDHEGSRSSINVTWMIVAMGYLSGLVVGVVAEHQVTQRNTRRKQQRRPRNTRRRN